MLMNEKQIDIWMLYAPGPDLTSDGYYPNLEGRSFFPALANILLRLGRPEFAETAYYEQERFGSLAGPGNRIPIVLIPELIRRVTNHLANPQLAFEFPPEFKKGGIEKMLCEYFGESAGDLFGLVTKDLGANIFDLTECHEMYYMPPALLLFKYDPPEWVAEPKGQPSRVIIRNGLVQPYQPGMSIATLEMNLVGN